MKEACIEATGRLEIADLARYQYYHSLRRTWPLVILLALVALVAVITFPFVLADSSSDWQLILANAVPFFLLLFFWLGLMLFLPYRNAKRQYAAQSYLRESTSFSFTQEEIALRADSVSSSMAWTAIREVRETQNLFLIYHGRNIAMVVPKRFFPTQDAITQWKHLVSSATGKLVSRGGVVSRWC